MHRIHSTLKPATALDPAGLRPAQQTQAHALTMRAQLLHHRRLLKHRRLEEGGLASLFVARHQDAFGLEAGGRRAHARSHALARVVLWRVLRARFEFDLT